MILVYSEGATGSVALQPGLIEGLEAPARTYPIVDHVVAVEAWHPVITAADAEEICRLTGFRLATPDEQDAYTGAKRKKNMLKEQQPSADSTEINGG